jgi:hypothetical protein
MKKELMTNTLVDIYAWLSLARGNVGGLWSAIEPAMSPEMREHYEIAMTEMTKPQTAIENALGGFKAVQVLLSEREEAGVE